MVALRLEDIKGDAPVDFDVYLHLPENDKYILYTPTGGVFYQKQKDRLKGKGVGQVHLRKGAEAAVEKYHMQNHVNEKIEAFQKNDDEPKRRK